MSSQVYPFSLWDTFLDKCLQICFSTTLDAQVCTSLSSPLRGDLSVLLLVCVRTLLASLRAASCSVSSVSESALQSKLIRRQETDDVALHRGAILPGCIVLSLEMVSLRPEGDTQTAGKACSLCLPLHQSDFAVV